MSASPRQHADRHAYHPEGDRQHHKLASPPPPTVWEPPQSYATWLVGVEPESPFSLANVPLGIISTTPDPSRRVATALGIWVLDLRELDRLVDLVRFLPELSESGGGGGASGGNNAGAGADDAGRANSSNSTSSNSNNVFAQPSLNALAALGRGFARRLRFFIQNIFCEATPLHWLLRDNDALKEKVLLPRELVHTHLPMHIGDYTDFYAGYHHAYAVGVLFRGPSKALQPNYVHMPVGYHGRASSVVVSDTPVRRPRGQIRPDDGSSPAPVTAPTRRLDFELEIGCFVCGDTGLGESVPVGTAEEHIFGYVLLNDWSARDVQAWEYVPLGPFCGKNFATTVSPWVVLADALERFKVEPLKIGREGGLQDYLCEERRETVFDLKLEVDLTTPDRFTTPLSRVSSRNLIWSFPQMIAHHTLGGCPLRTGDLLGTGTISGAGGPGQQGSLLEMTEGGRVEIEVREGEGRTFLRDGDTVTMRGGAEVDGFGVGFGDCVGRVVG